MPRIIKIVDGEEITDLDWLVGLVEKTSSYEANVAERTFTIRVPLDVSAKVDAMAKHSGITRNAMCVHLLDYAVNEVGLNLSAEASDSVRALYEALLIELAEANEFKEAE